MNLVYDELGTEIYRLVYATLFKLTSIFAFIKGPKSLSTVGLSSEGGSIKVNL